MQPSEKRKDKRVKRSCTVKVRSFQKRMDIGQSSGWEIVTMKDLSASGMLFTHTKKIPVGEILEFSISLPSSLEPIHCLGQVCRVLERQTSKISVAYIPVYTIAVFFKDIDASKQEAIKKICGGY